MNIEHYNDLYSYIYSSSSVAERLPNGEIDVNIEVNDNGNRKHRHFIIDKVGNIINEDEDKEIDEDMEEDEDKEIDEDMEEDESKENDSKEDESKEDRTEYPDEWSVKIMDTGKFRCVKPYDKDKSNKKQRIDSCDINGSYYYKKGMPEDGYENKQLCVEQCHLGKRKSKGRKKSSSKKVKESIKSSHTKRKLKYHKLSHKVKKPKNKSPSASGCVEQTGKKYMNRSSPNYPANKCCGKTLFGNDSHAYTSVPNKNGVCRWVKE
jgi:hypothetical protein